MTDFEKVEEISNRGGKREGSGRKAGVPNKISTTVKENVIAVFEELGGIKHMTEWAKENPNNYYNIYAKILPTQAEVSGTDGQEIVIKVVTGIDDNY
jgi:hypothetical protein